MSEPSKNNPAPSLENQIQLREITQTDLPILFEQQLDPEANFMAAFTPEDPTDREAFMAHWEKIMQMETVLIRTIELDGCVVGSVLSYLMGAEPQVSYWFGKEFWGKGIATSALAAFLKIQKARPIFGRVASDNRASARVLEKCGFVKIGEDQYFANARQREITENIFKLES